MTNKTLPAKFSLAPANLGEAMKFSQIIADSEIVPKDFRGKAGNVLVAIQMGMEIGLQPMQALQNIAVINGRPCIWGDSLPALAKRHRDFESLKETIEYRGGDKIENAVAVARIKRKGEPEHVVEFSWGDAQRAGLTTKDIWKNYPKRMLQMRARSWAVRDAFPDAFRGLYVAEEAQDIPPDVIEGESTQVDEPSAPRAAGLAGLEAALKKPADKPSVRCDGDHVAPECGDPRCWLTEEPPEHDETGHPEGSVEWWCARFNDAPSLTDLEKIGLELNALEEGEDKIELRKLYKKRWQALVPTDLTLEDA